MGRQILRLMKMDEEKDDDARDKLRAFRSFFIFYYYYFFLSFFLFHLTSDTVRSYAG